MRSSTDRTRSARAFWLASGMLSIVGASIIGGCNIAGPALWLVSDDRTPAVYQLDPKKSTVIIVDDRNSVLPSRAARKKLCESAEKALLEAKVLTADLIASESAESIMVADRFSKPKSVTAIGRALGAEQVIWVTVDEFTLSPDNAMYQPTATARVKIIDAANDKRLFPEGETSEGHVLNISIRTRTTEIPRNQADRLQAQLDLADRVGLRVSEMFFKSKPREADRKIGT